MTKLESDFEKWLLKEIERRLPGAKIFKGDSLRRQGVPDRIVLYGDKWAVLEVKRAHNSRLRPNQEYYVNQYNEMSYASFIYPENAKVVLDELQRALSEERCPRVP